MNKIRKGDTVQVAKGRDKGKKGRVITIFLERKRALVEGVQMLKKHKRQTRQDQQGGIVSIESPISIANLMLVCKSCGRAVRVGFKKETQSSSKTRFCKSCKQEI